MPVAAVTGQLGLGAFPDVLEPVRTQTEFEVDCERER
jgi:hypothetical protein